MHVLTQLITEAAFESRTRFQYAVVLNTFATQTQAGA